MVYKKEQKLLPCPFCGGEAKLAKNCYGQMSVQCKNDCCNAVVWGDSKDIDRDNAAIKAWNRRFNK